MARMVSSQEDRYNPPSFRRVDDHVVEESDMLIHEQFMTSDLLDTDPSVSANINMKAWLKTDPGQWILEHSVKKPYIVWYENAIHGGYTYGMMARLRKQDQTFFKMKFK